MGHAVGGGWNSGKTLGLYEICPPRNCGGREVFRKREKKLVTAKSGLEDFDCRFASVAWVDKCVFGL